MVVNEIRRIDSEYYKIINSWETIKNDVSKEYDLMVLNNNEQAENRRKLIESTDSIVEKLKEQRVYIEFLSNQYNLKINRDDLTCSFDPQEVLSNVFSSNLIFELSTELNNIIQTVDTDNLFFNKDETKV